MIPADGPLARVPNLCHRIVRLAIFGGTDLAPKSFGSKHIDHIQMLNALLAPHLPIPFALGENAHIRSRSKYLRKEL